MEVLSSTSPGWLRGLPADREARSLQLLRGLYPPVDSMFNQHAKWLKGSAEYPGAGHRLAQLPAHFARLAPGPQTVFRTRIPAHRPRGEQEVRGHPRLPTTGREHASLHRRPLPAQPPLRNVIVAGKQPALDYLSDEDAIIHCRAVSDLGMASNDAGVEPGRRLLGCAGDIPTLETLAAAAILRGHLPSEVRVVTSST